MIAGKDPMVGRALDLLVPGFAVNPDELLAAAYAGAATARATRRRRRTVAVVAFAALLLFAGAAIAADRAGLLPFLHTNDRNSARFSVSPSRTYHGGAPLALVCPGAKSGSFVCHVTGLMASGDRNYQLGMRTDKAFVLTRQSMLDSLDKAQADGADPAQVARVRADLSRVGDDFIRALAVMSRIETVSGSAGSTGPSGTERVPPHGVPAWVACRELTLTTSRCRPLAAPVGVAGGTPLYYLQPSRDWRAVQAPPQSPSDFARMLERLLGRKPNADETRFFIDFATVASTAGSSPGPTTGQGTPTAVSDPRGTALLAPQSLGVRTRAVSAVARPLPRRLPDGVTRSDRLYRVTFALLRPDGRNAAGRHTIYVYVHRVAKLGVWEVAWVASKP
jgi:hypothetical protein